MTVSQNKPQKKYKIYPVKTHNIHSLIIQLFILEVCINFLFCLLILGIFLFMLYAMNMRVINEQS